MVIKYTATERMLSDQILTLIDKLRNNGATMRLNDNEKSLVLAGLQLAEARTCHEPTVYQALLPGTPHWTTIDRERYQMHKKRIVDGNDLNIKIRTLYI